MARKTTGEQSEKKLKVLAFEKKIVASDAYMYETTWEKRDVEKSPIYVVEKSVRGTQSQRGAKQDQMESANIQTVDSAALNLSKDTLKLEFSLKFLSRVFSPTACNVLERYNKLQDMGNEYKAKYGYKELAKRYASNIANARFLWRNRLGAEAIEVIVKTEKDSEVKQWKFDAYDYNLKDFDTTDEKVLEIAKIIESVFMDEQNYALFEIEANVKMGVGQEVYPSEELIPNKEKDKTKEGRKSKVLYQVGSIAAMHSQKINNAIRTIDTWYSEFPERNIGPIAIEPYGSVTNLGEAFRSEKKESFYGIFDKYSPLGVLPDLDEESHFLAAILIRGGVFGESDKE